MVSALIIVKQVRVFVVDSLIITDTLYTIQGIVDIVNVINIDTHNNRKGSY